MSWPETGSSSPGVKRVMGKVTYDGSGVPSKARGFDFSITDDGTGLLTITTTFIWKSIVGFGHSMLRASAVGGSVEVVSEDASTRSFQLRVCNAAGAAADPASGDGFFFDAALQASSVPDGS